MKWLDEYEAKLKAASQDGAIHDQIVAQIEFENSAPEMVAKLIKAVRVAEETLEHISEYWNGSTESAVNACEEIIYTAEMTLANLQSGEFEEDE